MGLVLRELHIRDFRSHNLIDIENDDKLIIITGKNASGKTNIVEAVQLLTMTKSFRGIQWSNLVNHGAKKTSINAKFDQNGRAIEVQMTVDDGKRSYFLNGKKKNINEICGIIPGVMFIPDDLNLVKGSSQARRDLIDDIGIQLSQNYQSLVSDYKKTVKQRNLILKEQKDNYIDPEIMAAWNENLILLGASLFVHRIRLYNKLITAASDNYSKFLENEELTSAYIPSFLDDAYDDIDRENPSKEQVEEHLRKALQTKAAEERASAKTLVGPHKDEIKFFINNRDARSFASQGQQRSIALALKFAQLSIVKELSGNQPILLLDDVMSELDAGRRAELLRLIDDGIQTIITATDLHYFEAELISDAKIINLS